MASPEVGGMTDLTGGSAGAGVDVIGADSGIGTSGSGEDMGFYSNLYSDALRSPIIIASSKKIWPVDEIERKWATTPA